MSAAQLEQKKDLPSKELHFSSFGDDQEDDSDPE